MCRKGRLKDRLEDGTGYGTVPEEKHSRRRTSGKVRVRYNAKGEK